ncbi:MAG TPA: pyridoxamine 5'-phosphate oxidase family protein [Gemmatimonadaceae bacterium]|jgi:hypothetical protein|nr:pyridoxamine 5'-phosphate oxidase family protein [Gemmatimonadaceae bacterium]
MMLTPDMRAVIRAANLCFAATVTPDGRPNVSPKGTIGVWDDSHLFFLDIASPGTRANLAHTPWMEINVVEQLSRRGYRFAGPASLYGAGTPEFDEGVQRLYGGPRPDGAPAGVVVLTVERAAPLLSPAYWRDTDEAEIRRNWRERRAALDREFEAHIASVGPIRVNRSAS